MYNDFSYPTVANWILWDNTGGNIGGFTLPDVTHSDVQGGWPGTGNIDTDPCFVELGYWADASDPNIIVEPNDPNAVWVEGDYHLRPGSPCIDTGDNNSVPADTGDLDGDGNTAEPIPFDIDGNPRFMDGDCNDTVIVDMGAYELIAGDLESDGDVDFGDHAVFAWYWMETGCGLCGGADLTGDGNVDWNDLRESAENWLVGAQ
jgi:hypothetical protein